MKYFKKQERTILLRISVFHFIIKQFHTARDQLPPVTGHYPK